jgi:hypothetical protein
MGAARTAAAEEPRIDDRKIVNAIFYVLRTAAHQIAAVVHRAMARVERFVPVSIGGSFIPAGNSLDAMAAVAKVLGKAKADVLIVDPYMDEKALTDFAPTAPEGVQIRLLADEKFRKPALAPAVTRWRTQFGARRPLTARLSPPSALHDRAIFLDGAEVWLVSQSFNSIAAGSPATITKILDVETATLKLGAYEAIWSASTNI